MKTKLTQRLWPKVVAIILLLLCEVAAVLSVVGIVLCYENGVYEYDEQNGLVNDFYRSSACSIVCTQIYQDYQWEFDLHEQYEKPGTELEPPELTELETLTAYVDEVLGDMYWPSDSNALIQIFGGKDSSTLLYANRPADSITVAENSLRTYYLYPGMTMEISVADPLITEDNFYYARQGFNLALEWRFIVLIVAAASILLFLIALIYLFCAVGHKKGHEEIVLTAVDKIPLDLLAAGFVAFLAVFHNVWVDAFGWSTVDIATLIAGEILGVWLLLSFAVRCKAGTVFKNTVIFRAWKLLLKLLRRGWHLCRSIYRVLPLIWKAVLLVVTLIILEIVLFCGAIDGPGIFLILFLLLNVFLAFAICFGIWQLLMLQKAGRELASGNFDHKVNTEKMYWEFRKHGENLNSIGLGMAIAVDQRTRSERLKTELITNVSHDIKTPLTSIINYVDLLQRPELTDEERAEYLEILARQSGRLKKLTEDLVEASKASTGNMTVTLVPTSVKELLDQAVAEYGERLEAGKLEPILHLSDPELSVMADGRLLWRVMDNLLNNVCKYALSGTRVYLDARAADGAVIISVKNVSRDPLNVSEEELMERFVRGDVARSTEGSGLGLNIARSLTELQHGTFSLTIDGDLFKAEICLRQ